MAERDYGTERFPAPGMHFPEVKVVPTLDQEGIVYGATEEELAQAENDLQERRQDQAKFMAGLRGNSDEGSLPKIAQNLLVEMSQEGVRI